MSVEDHIRAIATETAAFERDRMELLKEHRGEYALYKGDECIGTFPTFALAYYDGVRRFGLVPFLIKQIFEEDEIVMIFRSSAGVSRAHTQ